jgi:hypothetical protein
VLREYRHRNGLRRWNAAATAFAFAVYVLLSPLMGGTPSAWQQIGANDHPFVICHGTGADTGTDEGQPAKQPLDSSHCVFCALANSCAIHPATVAILPLDVQEFSRIAVPLRSQVTEYRSATGEYQRGPPIHSATS